MQADTELLNLITDIQTLVTAKSPLTAKIRDVDGLIKSLNELKDMVDMAEVKRTVIQQIQFLLVQDANSTHMLHAVISGDPGTGKTTVAGILAKIWMAMGVIGGNQAHTPNYEARFEKCISAMHETVLKLSDISTQSRVLTAQSRRALKEMRAQPYSKRKMVYDRHIDSIAKDAEHLNYALSREAMNLISVMINPDPEVKVLTPKITIASAPDLIGQYIGQTAIKTQKVLDNALDGVLFIDEAYALCNADSPRDYGKECLSVINEYMSKYPTRLIVIFAGYRDMLDATIFKIQPGLSRRCTWTFNISKYSAQGLSRILIKQLGDSGWRLAEDVDIVNIIGANASVFEFGGGSTDKFSLYCKLTYGTHKFKEALNNVSVCDKVITQPMLKDALAMMYAHQRGADEHAPQHMYM